MSLRSGSTTSSMIISMAFLSLSSSWPRTSERVFFTSAFSCSTSAAYLLFAIRAESHADSGAATIAMSARITSVVSIRLWFLYAAWSMPMLCSHFCTSKLGHAFAATSLWPMILTFGWRRWKALT